MRQELLGGVHKYNQIIGEQKSSLALTNMSQIRKMKRFWKIKLTDPIQQFRLIRMSYFPKNWKKGTNLHSNAMFRFY